MRTKAIGCLVLWTVLLTSLRAADEKHAVVPGDYSSIATITQIAVSPDGKWVAYCDARWQLSTDDRKTDLWLVATDGQSLPRRLTSDRANDRDVKWSADGKSLYFVGNRKREAEKKAPYDGTTQVWRMGMEGGEPQAVTKVEGGITGYDLATKANVLFYSVDLNENDDDAFSKIRNQYGKLEYGHGKRQVSQVWRLDLTNWRAEKVVDEKRYVRQFAVTSDAKRIGLISAYDELMSGRMARLQRLPLILIVPTLIRPMPGWRG